MLGVSDTEMESFVERWMGSTGDVIVAVRLLFPPPSLSFGIGRES